jgi:hypothetical protein
LEVFHEPERIAPVAIRDAEYSAWGAGYASFGKGAVNPHLSAARALGDDLKKGIKERPRFGACGMELTCVEHEPEL